MKCARYAAEDFPKIKHETAIVDALCMQLVRDPTQFDVLLLPNLYGDIVSDLCAGLVGGLGLVPGSNMGKHEAVFEAVHGSAPDIAGKNIANPTAMILTGTMMLEHMGEHDASDRIRRAIEKVIIAQKTLTPDIGGTATTDEYTKAIIEAL